MVAPLGKDGFLWQDVRHKRRQQQKPKQAHHGRPHQEPQQPYALCHQHHQHLLHPCAGRAWEGCAVRAQRTQDVLNLHKVCVLALCSLDDGSPGVMLVDAGYHDESFVTGGIKEDDWRPDASDGDWRVRRDEAGRGEVDRLRFEARVRRACARELCEETNHALDVSDDRFLIIGSVTRDEPPDARRGQGCGTCVRCTYHVAAVNVTAEVDAWGGPWALQACILQSCSVRPPPAAVRHDDMCEEIRNVRFESLWSLVAGGSTRLWGAAADVLSAPSVRLHLAELPSLRDASLGLDVSSVGVDVEDVDLGCS